MNLAGRIRSLEDVLMDEGSVAAGNVAPPGRVKHRLDGGPRLQSGADGIRFYTVECSCGWESEHCGSAVLAEAVGEQHITFTTQRRSRTA